MPNEPDLAIEIAMAEMVNDLSDDVEKKLYLVFRTVKVFCRQKVDGYYLYLSISAPRHEFADLLRSLAMPMANIFKTCLPCPAPVAISHHSDVLCLRLTFELGNKAGFISWVQQCGKKFHTCILSCCATGANRRRQLC